MSTTVPEKVPSSIKPLLSLRYDVILDMYRRKAQALKVEALRRRNISEILTYYTIEILGPALTGSIAFALDPLWQFAKPDKFVQDNPSLLRLFPTIVQPVNRVRKHQANIPGPLILHLDQESKDVANAAHFVPFFWSMSGEGTVFDNHDYATLTVGQQSPFYWFCKDTTVKTRNSASQTKVKKKINKSESTTQAFPFGEFELYKPRFFADDWSYSFLKSDGQDWTLQGVSGPHGEQLWGHHRTTNRRSGHFTPANASIDAAAIQQLGVDEGIYARGLMNKHAPTLVSRAVPGRRYYNLIYQVAELRDLPKTIKSTLALWVELERSLGKKSFVAALLNPRSWTPAIRNRIGVYSHALKYDVRPDQKLADAYLNFKFGWQSMIQAVNQLVETPPRIGKDINNLIKQNGKPTTLRSTMKWSEPVLSSPAVTFPLSPDMTLDPAYPASSGGTRNVELRVVVNSGINFPDTDLPTLRRRLYLNKIGLSLSPGDIYDLIPWSWMIDWFLGAGDYLHVMEAVNADPGLINYGFITYVSNIEVTSRCTNVITRTTRQNIIPPNTSPLNSFIEYVGRSAVFKAKYQLRLSLSNIAAVKLISGQGLSPYQESIVGALFSKYIR